MDMQTMRNHARERFQGSCRVCRDCDGVVCAGEVPGMGGVGTGVSFQNNIRALRCWQLRMKTLHSVVSPHISAELWGNSLSLPVLAAPIGGIAAAMHPSIDENEYENAIVEGCRQMGLWAMTGDGSSPLVFETGLAQARNFPGSVVPTIKPHANTADIIEKGKQAAALGAPAFAVDVDAAAFPNMHAAGMPVGPKKAGEWAKVQEKVGLPLILKGIMTPEEAESCVSVGIAGIVVSNHGGRAMDHTPGTARVLPTIAEKVKGQISLFVDGGIRSGADILKMLALGADFILLGRPLAIAAVGGGAEGVYMQLKKMESELRSAMILTGTTNVLEVSKDILQEDS